MPPRADDPGIADDQFLLRALHKKWVVAKEGRERPSTEAMTDSNYENSCFVAGEIKLEEIRTLIPGRRLARIPVRVVRAAGFVIERRPDEAPLGCTNPRSHVVVGPTREVRRIEYEAAAKQIVKHAETAVLPEPVGQNPLEL